MKDPFSLAGRVAIVAGAGQGIGKAIPLGLADYGANVVAAGRNPERLADPSEIVGLAVYLASDASSYLTGQTILISGGLDTLLIPDA